MPIEGGAGLGEIDADLLRRYGGPHEITKK
jgi:hypothetical protein